MVTTEVILRKGFETSLIITEELARYMLVWLVFLAGALGIRDKSHIRINALVKHLNPRASDHPRPVRPRDVADLPGAPVHRKHPDPPPAVFADVHHL